MPRYPAPHRGADPVPAVERAARMLLALGDGGAQATLTELARHLRINKSTAHSILATLIRHRFVSRDPLTKRYRLGPGLAAIAGAAAHRSDLAALARPHLDRLQHLSGETVTLHVRDGAGSIILGSRESSHQLKVTAPPGHRLPLFAGAVAKVLLAFAVEAPRLPPRLPAYTPRTIGVPVQYLEELARVRRAGVAYDEMEYLPGVRAVSAPVFCGGGGATAEAVAALSIVGVAARVSPADLRRLAGPLQSAARGLSTMLRPPLALRPTSPGRDAGRNDHLIPAMRGKRPA
jgi:DNA-binding IclR family transcriptional regulator